VAFAALVGRLGLFLPVELLEFMGTQVEVRLKFVDGGSVVSLVVSTVVVEETSLCLQFHVHVKIQFLLVLELYFVFGQQLFFEKDLLSNCVIPLMRAFR